VTGLMSSAKAPYNEKKTSVGGDVLGVKPTGDCDTEENGIGSYPPAGHGCGEYYFTGFRRGDKPFDSNLLIFFTAIEDIH